MGCACRDRARGSGRRMNAARRVCRVLAGNLLDGGHAAGIGRGPRGQRNRGGEPRIRLGGGRRGGGTGWTSDGTLKAVVGTDGADVAGPCVGGAASKTADGRGLGGKGGWGEAEGEGA